MKRLAAVLIILLGLFPGVPVADAQELKFSIISDIEADPFDMTAREVNRNDGDGYPYAIIKVTSDIEDDDLSKFDFSFGYIKSEEEVHDGELWIYVARGAKTVDIRRDGYKPILKHQFKAIREGTTYTMRLSVQTPKVVNRVLQFKVEPANENAIVKVRPEGSDGSYELWGTVDATGSISRLLETGAYLYEVSADNYVTSQGRVALTASTDGENFIENVRLTPNFGFLKIDDVQGIAGAEVYVNDRKVGTVPYISERMECGDDYRLMISNGELYKTYSGTFAITRGDTTILTPRLESNFAETTIRVDGDAEIFINGESRGRGTWTGPLRAGSYSVECRLPNHVSSTKQIVVRPDFAETFLMDRPAPIEGSLYVNTNPSGAAIYIDGEDMGFVTPRNIGNLLIGHHQVTLMLANHRTETHDVEILQGETAQLDVKLSDMADMTIESTPSSASLYVNGEYVGTTPYREEMASGEYRIRLEKNGFRTWIGTVHLDSSNPVQTFPLRRQYQQRHQLYVQPMFQIGASLFAGAAVGFFVGNVNFEADYLFGLDSETIYWNNSGGDVSIRPVEDKLSPSYVSIKAGYGFTIGTRLRITPQVGGGIVKISGQESSSYDVSGSVGVRADIVVANHISVVAAPEYGISITESDTFRRIASVSSKVGGWSGGFNIRVGLSIYL